MLQRYAPTAVAMLVMGALISAVVVSASHSEQRATALPASVVPEPEFITVEAKAGEEVWLTWSGVFDPQGGDLVFVDAVELVRVHPDLRILRLRAVNSNLGGPARPPAALVGPLDPKVFPDAAVQPISNAVFRPGRAGQSWYFIAGVVAPKAGTYRIGGWRLRYSAGAESGATTFAQRVEIHVR